MVEGRRIRAIVSVLVVAGLFVPVALDRDSFPLSTHPMYATARHDPVERLPTVVGVDATGVFERLTLGLIAATDDPLVAQARIRNAIAAGREHELCAEVADRVSNDAGRSSVDLVRVQIERIDLVGFLTDDEPPDTVQVRAECEVRR
ncbi:MAG: hypothetical protein ACR2P0_12205 [Acidimicrobiales bacterium]